MSNKILIIAGMYRSGTSLVTQWLKCCGLNVGVQLLGADIGNVDGHFEDIDFYRFHEDTLEEHNESRFGWVTHPIELLTSYQKEKLKSIIYFKNNMSAQWGWKDPRTCLFFAHYRELIPDAYYLNVIRDYKSTVNSMIIRDFKHHEIKYLSRKAFSRFIWKNFRRKKRLLKFYGDLSQFYLSVWLTYNEEILKNIQRLDEGKYLVIDSSSLCTINEQVFGHLKDDWNFDLNYFDFRKIFKASLFSPPTDIDVFVTDKSLQARAQQLEKQLKNLCTTDTIAPKELL
jgi:hypothetical protein